MSDVEDLDIRTIPIILYIMLPISFVVLWLWGVAEDHFEAFSPYISDLGARAPESCLFSQVLNIAAVLFALTFYFRYLLLRDFGDRSGLRRYDQYITANLVLGMLGALGISFVGNYQSIFITPLHMLGACLVLGLGIVYMWIDVHVSRYAHIAAPLSRRCLIGRTLLATFSTITLLFMIAGNQMGQHHLTHQPRDLYERLHWTRESGGYKGHIVGAVSEWLLLILELSYFGTFISEFGHFRMRYPMLLAVNPNITPVKNIERIEDMDERHPMLAGHKKQWDGGKLKYSDEIL
ncbi:DNA damage-regulated autophagy modulator protein 2-like [Paramacrobiotus metropolitanus]|uniref:DNA damage-regulated autophagy modulator protein 2-like n=1 Tax=Paramacrobiotus metropolitanus TaxID=2943436 RepID=UPI002445DB23|nr:DNA damage-regulated autophagy modulator protein 2-like [Paramacrobiotus metropolitanus]